MISSNVVHVLLSINFSDQTEGRYRLVLTAEAASRESLHMNPGILLHPPSTEADRVKAIEDVLRSVEVEGSCEVGTPPCFMHRFTDVMTVDRLSTRTMRPM